MSMFPRPVRPSRALGDLWQFVRSRTRHEVFFGFLAVGITALWFVAIFNKLNPDPEYKAPPVFYAKQWTANRTVADVRAQQKKDLPGELAAQREREEAARIQRQRYDKLAKQFGLD